MADDPDLGAAARIARGGLDLDDSVVNLGHFLREQLLHEVGMGAAEENLRPARLAADGHDQRADAVADADHLARDLLVAADDALGAAEVDDDVAELDALDDAGDDLADAVLELFILALALGIADLLEDHLLGGLGGDPPEFDRRQRVDDEVADARVLVELLGALEVDLLEMILGLLDDFEDAPQAQVAGLGVELGADVVLGAIAGAGGALDRVFHRLDDDALVDQLLARDRVGDRDQLGPVGADGSGCGGHSSYSSTVSMLVGALCAERRGGSNELVGQDELGRCDCGKGQSVRLARLVGELHGVCPRRPGACPRIVCDPPERLGEGDARLMPAQSR